MVIQKIEKYQDVYIEKLLDIAVRNCSSKKYDILYAFEDIEKFRNTDYENHLNEEGVLVRLNIAKENQIFAILSFFKTTFICVLIVVISLVLSKDAQELVLTPLESIMEKLNRMAVDPFQVLYFNDEDNEKG